MSTPPRAALRMTILIGHTDLYRHRPLYAEIVHRAHARGLAGASVFHGIEGFGACSVIHTSHLFSLSDTLPVAIVIIDTDEKINAFLPELDDLLTGGLIILDEVTLHPPAREPTPHAHRWAEWWHHHHN